jgi:hypothetical protein
MFRLFLVVVVEFTVLFSGLFLFVEDSIGLESKKVLNPIPFSYYAKHSFVMFDKPKK